MADTPTPVRYATDSDITSILGRRDRTRGDLLVGGGVRVNGIVRGNIEPVGDDCAVIVSTGGQVKGDMRVARARIDGSVTGAIDIEGHLEVTAGAVIDGDITYGSMSVEAGARVNGHVRCRHAGFNERE